MITECSECLDTHYINVNTCTPCNVACNGCTAAGNDNCKLCNELGATKYKTDPVSNRCLATICGNKENFFVVPTGTESCDVGLTPTGDDILGCVSCVV